MKAKQHLKRITTLALVLAVSSTLFIPSMVTAKDITPVTVKTFMRAETDVAIKRVHDQIGFNKWFHFRMPAPLDKQDVIRINRDTIYSSAVLDLSKPVTITMPDASGRYMSLHVINQGHYSFVVSKSGAHKLTQEKVGSRYAYLIVRTFVDPDDPNDIKAANAAQDAMTIAGGGNGPLDVPNWNMEQLLEARSALNTLAKLGGNAALAFGTKEEVSPIDHLVFGAAGWGGLPQKSAFYDIATVTKNDGTPHTVTAKDVPVDAFWSITVYGADGFIKENPEGHYSFNNITAKPNKDGSVTINFGDCEDGRVNCLPILTGWNYAVRMYEPRKEILDGSWKFPEIKPVK
jgi:hypothetical protein